MDTNDRKAIEDLFGKLASGGEVHVSLKDDKLSFELTPAAPGAAKLGKKRRAGGAAPAAEEQGEQD